jgi:hypothetical protein
MPASPRRLHAYLEPLRDFDWVVYAKEPFAGPKQVLCYLSRYTHHIAISNRRLVSANANGVAFKYKDYRIDGPARYKTDHGGAVRGGRRGRSARTHPRPAARRTPGPARHGRERRWRRNDRRLRVARAAPDGYQFVIGTSGTHAQNQSPLQITIAAQ